MTSAAPLPPVIPPCQRYNTESGLMSSTKFISIILPTFSSTATFSKFALTVRRTFSSSELSIYEPSPAKLSCSSPAVLPKITRAVLLVLAISAASSLLTGISFCDQGSPPQPLPRSNGFSASQPRYIPRSFSLSLAPFSRRPSITLVTFDTFTIPPEPVPLL